MSKAELIELIKLDDYDLKDWLYTVGVDEAREIFIQAMKDVEQDTKNGCASKIHTDRPDDLHPILNLAQCSCLNYQDKDLAGL